MLVHNVCFVTFNTFRLYLHTTHGCVLRKCSFLTYVFSVFNDGVHLMPKKLNLKQ